MEAVQRVRSAGETTDLLLPLWRALVVFRAVTCGRSIDDGVLQALAQVQRPGTAIGGEATELAALVAEQEVALRTLMASRPAR